MKKAFYIFAAAFVFVISSCKKDICEPQTVYSLGTICVVNLYEDGTYENYSEIINLLKDIDNRFSVNKEDSEISKVNRSAGSGNAVNVSKEVYEVVEQSLEFARLTRNSFNPAMGSLIKMWGIGTDHQRIPGNEEIAEVLGHCNPHAIKLTEVPGYEESENLYLIEITDSKTQLDLGAIVKGYATDKIVEILKANNIKRAIVNLGGNIYVYGQKSKFNPDEMWNVGIKNPVNPDAGVIETVSLKSGSVVTSGNYERYFEENGKRYHHILDSKTGYPAESGLASVSIIYDKSIVCDALATACYVSGVNGDFNPYELGFDGIKIVFIDFNGKPVIE